MSTSTHLSAPCPTTTRKGSAPPRTNRATPPAPAARRPDLERQSITFTIGLYLFICTALLGTHLLAAGHDDAPVPASLVTTTAPAGATSSGTDAQLAAETVVAP
ncbi:hypothetical protein EQW78_02270 [Oerskovia turbata]|uniref:Uncharacterized protein n=1 Tax=Oerskovia turbata TaxID=1713 RepID=A0A4Q1L0Z1_9CELL|nr:hypothetical protein [Oerskovia turbata]RXR27024.1 hypothetical protein EQW73_06150 [Oerskovia turbata]RXR36408.1 hypothetical protein EQW78_02270 [Oerskovia turbata]TGJ95431.1 hypothetical protein DLJ96_12785 [Actinotalea fermentans ATCC 43279 = JCM 9966 = DSM 3133]